MALPKQLKTARESNDTLVSQIDDNTNALEQDLSDLLGLTLDVNENLPIVGALYSEITDANTIANTNVETAFNKSYTIPANGLRAGSVIRLSFAGTLAWNTPTQNITIRARIGGSNIAVIQLSLTGASPGPFSGEILISARVIGAGGSLYCAYGWIIAGAAAVAATQFAQAAEVTLAKDTTGALVADLSVQWASASPSNTITMKQLAVEILRAVSTS